jgi:AcrR family transcriptional regulator
MSEHALIGEDSLARPKSDKKRKAILNAAVELFADKGIAHAPTSAISACAGVAEGTLFTYFKTKDELLNELYR